MSTMTVTPDRPAEKVIEKALMDACAVHGIMYLKFISGVTGVPDRILQGLNAAGVPLTVYVEVKRPGEHPRPRQKEVMNRLIGHGGFVFVVDARDYDLHHFSHHFHTVESLLDATFLSYTLPRPEKFELTGTTWSPNTYTALPTL